MKNIKVNYILLLRDGSKFKQEQISIRTYDYLKIVKLLQYHQVFMRCHKVFIWYRLLKGGSSLVTSWPKNLSFDEINIF